MAQHAYFEAAVDNHCADQLSGRRWRLRARGKTSEAIKRLIGLAARRLRVLFVAVLSRILPIEEVGLDDTLARASR